MFSVGDKRAMNRGFGDGMTQAVEIVLIPAMFAGIGWLIDRALDTSPWFTIALGVFGVLGMFAKMWVTYDLKMKAEEAQVRARRDAAKHAVVTADQHEDVSA